MHKITSQALADFLRYWISLRQGARIPLRRDVDPAEIPPSVLPFVFTMVVERDPLHFCASLSGTGIRQLVSKEKKGDRISEDNLGPNFQDVFDTFAATVAARTACWGKVRFPGALPDGSDLMVESAFMPLSETGEDVDYICGANIVLAPPEYRLMVEPGIFMTRRWQMIVTASAVDEAALPPPRRSLSQEPPMPVTPVPAANALPRRPDTALS